jgi:hypothetical protein
MSQHSQRTQDGPSAASIIAGAALTIGAVVVAGWVIAGSALDGRHLAGYGGWMLLALLLAGQTIVRAAEWQSIREQARDQESRRREAEAEAARQEQERRAKATGVWRGDGPGQVLTVRLNENGFLVVQGWLSDYWHQHEERTWSHPIEELTDLVQELENSGELKPADDEGTIFMRTLLDLGAWPLPSFDEIERDWTKRDGDTQVVSQTA